MYKNKISFVLSFLFLLFISLSAHSAIPQSISYQAYLTGPSGDALNGTFNIEFKIYNVSTGGTALWTGTQSVSVTNGLFNVKLGDGTFPVDMFSTPLWLGINVQGDGEMTPRSALTSAGFAFKAEDAETLGGLPPSAFLSSTGGGVTGPLAIDGNLSSTGDGNVGGNFSVGGNTSVTGNTAVSGALSVNGLVTANNGIQFSDGSSISRAPRVIETPDTRVGCPPSAAVNSDLISQTINLANNALVTVHAQMARIYSGRADLNIYVDAIDVSRYITYTASQQWVTATPVWTGVLASGTHIVSVRDPSRANLWGCGASYGFITTTIIEY